MDRPLTSPDDGASIAYPTGDAFRTTAHAALIGRTLDDFSLHGVDHWRRVERNGLWCAARCGGDPLVVSLFAWLHDCRRLTDGLDRYHGVRAARLVQDLADELTLPPADLDRLAYACRFHADGHTTDDPTIGACWDADRLDLTRVGGLPHADYLSTEPARAVVEEGDWDALWAIALREPEHPEDLVPPLDGG